MSKTMLITGVSTGLGRAIAAEALARGHRVVGTVRTEESRAGFEALRPGHAFGRILDVTRTAEIAPLVVSIEATAGPIDVLINNAGYGHRGVVEEITPDELRRQLEVNVIGAVAVIQPCCRRCARVAEATSSTCPRWARPSPSRALPPITRASSHCRASATR